MPKKTGTDPHDSPFRTLRHLLKKKDLPLKSPEPETAAPGNEATSDPDAERRLFQQAMDGVQPFPRDGRMRIPPTAKPPEPPRRRETKSEAMQHLQRLVETGEGFHVADTPEYREGVGHNVPQGITRHLHKGQFSIQDHIDLHGLRSAEAEEALLAFFKEAVATGKRVVLIVHGRGLSSPDKPVLKVLVHRWLAAGPWRHWVMAYSSARACDGGAGATYVLLRQRPLTRRHRRKKRADRS